VPLQYQFSAAICEYSHLTFSYGNAVIQPDVAYIIGHMPVHCDNLPSLSRVGAPVTAVVEVHERIVVGGNQTLKVGEKGAVAATERMIGTTKLPSDAPFAASFRKKEILAFRAIRTGEID
jgi:hypothetical protein